MLIFGVSQPLGALSLVLAPQGKNFTLPRTVCPYDLVPPSQKGGAYIYFYQNAVSPFLK